jgi:hypothetical protein
MNITSISFVLMTLAASGGGGGGPSEPEWVGANGTSGIDCDFDFDDDALAAPVGELEPFSQTETNPQGGWWWLRFDALVYLDTDEMTLVSLDRAASWSFRYSETEPYLDAFLYADLSESSRASELYTEQYTVMALQSPNDAAPGEAFELRRGSTTIAVLGVRQEAEPPATARSLSITIVDKLPQICDARCVDPDLSIPRSPVLQIDYQGDPAVLSLQLKATCNGAYWSDIFVDVFALSQTASPIRVVDTRDIGLQGDCIITHDYTTLFDANTRQQLVMYTYDEIGTLEAAPVAFYENGEPVEREACGFFAGTIWDPETRTRDLGLPCACVVIDERAPVTAFAAALAIPLLLRRRRGRRV